MTRRESLFAALALFASCAAIASFPAGAFIRGTAGDILVTAMLYFAWRAAAPSRSRILSAAAVLVFALVVEATQALGLRAALGVRPHSILGIVLGGTFDWLDCAAYAAGVSGALALDAIATQNRRRAEERYTP